jgi:hypothetical protein
VVDQLDLQPFLRAYRADGHGRAADDPKALLICGRGRRQQAGAGVPGLAARACRLREGGSSQAPLVSHGGSPPVDRLQGGWIPVRAPRLISVLGDDSGDMMAMG